MPNGACDPDKEGVPIALAMKLTPDAYFERVNKLLIDNPAYSEDCKLLDEPLCPGQFQWKDRLEQSALPSLRCGPQAR